MKVLWVLFPNGATRTDKAQSDISQRFVALGPISGSFRAPLLKGVYFRGGRRGEGGGGVVAILGGGSPLSGFTIGRNFLTFLSQGGYFRSRYGISTGYGSLKDGKRCSARHKSLFLNSTIC